MATRISIAAAQAACNACVDLLDGGAGAGYIEIRTGSQPATVAWATSGELNSLSRGGYVVQITATRTSDSKQRIMQTSLRIDDAIS